MAKPEQRKEKRGPVIIRDGQVPRITADVFYVYPLSDAVDVALLMSSPDYSGQSFELASGGKQLSADNIQPQPALVEVGRLRLDTDAIRNLLKMLIGVSVGADLVSLDDVAEILEQARGVKNAPIES